MTKSKLIDVTAIDSDNRLRGVDNAKVKALALSIADVGLRAAIEVRRTETGYALISGLHRLEAVRSLGHPQIAARVVPVDEIGARALEIAENLIRSDLNPLDRARFVVEDRKVFEAQHGPIRSGRRQKNQDVPKPGWADSVCERTGMTKDQVERSLRIANGLTEDSVERLRGTPWADNQAALLLLAPVPPVKQTAVLNALYDDDAECKTMQHAIDMALGDKRNASEEDKWLIKATSSFQKQAKRDQLRFLREVIGIIGPDEVREAFDDLGLAPVDASKDPRA